MADESSLPKFKYHPNLFELGILDRFRGTCECCNDFCAYLGPVGTKELEELGIADDLFEEDGSFDGWEGARNNLEKDGWISGPLFRCLHCGGYRLIVEAG